jgi:hypothetical protein
MENLKLYWKKELNRLTDTSSLYKHLDNELEKWYPIGIVEISKVNYSNNARIIDDDLLYTKVNEHIINGITHYYVWETNGYFNDEYSGYLLYPLNNDNYFKIFYIC